MVIKDKSCENYARVARASAGFAYAHFQNFLMGRDPIVLKGAGPDGQDLQFVADWEFLDENHPPGRFGYDKKDGEELSEHVSNCTSPLCREAFARTKTVSQLTKSGGHMDGVMIASQFQPKNGSEPLVLVRESGWGDTIDDLAPVFRWYIDGRSDFVWPGEGRVRLEGVCNVAFNQGEEGACLSDIQKGWKSITIPFSKIRKLREGGRFAYGCGGRDIWRNPELYHVGLSHANEESYSSTGTMTIELREDLEGVEHLVKSILRSGINLSRVKN